MDFKFVCGRLSICFSDKFIEKFRGSRLFGEWHLGKMWFWDMAILVIFWSIVGDIMASSGLIDFKIGLHIKVNVNAGQNKFEAHIYQFAQNGHQLAQNSPDAILATLTLFGHNLVIFHQILTLFFSKCLFFLIQIEWWQQLSSISFTSDFVFALVFAPRPHMGSIAHMDPKLPSNVGTCTGLPTNP